MPSDLARRLARRARRDPRAARASRAEHVRRRLSQRADDRRAGAAGARAAGRRVRVHRTDGAPQPALVRRCRGSRRRGRGRAVEEPHVRRVARDGGPHGKGERRRPAGALDAAGSSRAEPPGRHGDRRAHGAASDPVVRAAGGSVRRNRGEPCRAREVDRAADSRVRVPERTAGRRLQRRDDDDSRAARLRLFVHDAAVVRVSRRAAPRAVAIPRRRRGDRRGARAPAGARMAPMSARVCVVTAGHLSTCPRMLKAADALHGAGCTVRVVSANHTPWAQAADRDVMRSRTWGWTVVDYARETAAAARIATGARFKAAGALAAGVGVERVPMGVATRAFSRAHDELVRAVASEPADVVYGGTTGALGAVAEAAADLGVPYGIDLEDFHSGERDDAEGGHEHALAGRIERAAIAGATFVTASSPMISSAYADKYGVAPITIHNTFSIARSSADADERAGPLRLYWFSQTIGAGRGLEDVIRAAGRVGASAELHLRGRGEPAYLATMRALQQNAAPHLCLVLHEPAPPDQMVPLA